MSYGIRRPTLFQPMHAGVDIIGSIQGFGQRGYHNQKEPLRLHACPDRDGSCCEPLPGPFSFPKFPSPWPAARWTQFLLYRLLGILGTSDPYSIPKSNPFTKESGVSNLLDDTQWAVNEFVEAELGDERRTERLVVLAGVLAQHPTALPEACK